MEKTMKLLILSFVVLVIRKHTVSAFSFNDVCAKKDLCSLLVTNIACQANKIKLCSGGQMINPNATEKQNIADVHNSLRNVLAHGTIPGFKSATRMATMEWDDELAAMVILNIKRCVFGHDKCHNTPNFPTSGQNLAFVKGYEHNTFNRAAVIKEFAKMINDWFSEYKKATMNIIRNSQNLLAITTESNATTNVIQNSQNLLNGVTHFTDISIDKNNRVGCAGVWYTENDIGRVNFGCNYAFTTMLDLPIYTEGLTASKCKTGRNSKYSGLCSSNEKYD